MAGIIENGMNFIMVDTLTIEPVQNLITAAAAALGCGLLIGLERERSKQRENQHSFAGIRSFAICSLLGAICFSFGLSMGLVGALIIGGISIISTNKQIDDPGVTTELAFILTYFIGGLCLWHIPYAAALTVVLTFLLMTKHSMHGVAVKWITELEFKDGIFLLALLLIALPLTPDRDLWGSVLNPYIILKLLTLILAIQALAHVAKRILPSHHAMFLSALASGFVSSTATIASLGIEVRHGRGDAKENAGAALISCVATLVQLLIIVAGVSFSWLKILLVPSIIAIIILIIPGIWLMRNTQSRDKVKSTDTPMFSLKEAGIIVVTLTIIQALVYGLSLWLGDAGLIAGTVLSSMFEMHAAMAAVVMQGNPTNPILLLALLLGLATHAISKSINAAITGGFQYALAFVPTQIIHMTVLIVLIYNMT